MERIPDVSPELPSRTWRLLLLLLERMPERALSRSFGAFADLTLPRSARRPILTSFARAVGIDLREVERPLEDYPTLNDFFVRRLVPGARSWPDDAHAIASPVDGILGRSGSVREGRVIQAKGRDYTVAELLAEGEQAKRYVGGSYLTIYLSPRHYHRIHTPTAGSVRLATYVSGALLPVNAAAVMHVPRLFARNERLITYVDGARGRIAVVAVGAYNVGRISAAYDPAWSGDGRGWITNRRVSPPARREYEPPIALETGEEIMAFHLGSTVVLLFEPMVELSVELKLGAEIRLGEPIAGD